jgi:transcription antitermination factor NusG
VVVYSNWLILELNDIAEGVGYREIESAIITTFGCDVDYFIPIHHEKMGSYTSTSTLMEGYAFVRDTPEARASIINLRDQRIFARILHHSGKFQTVDAQTIAVLKRKLKNSLKRRFDVGSKVFVMDGIFKNLTGEVIGIEDDGKQVMIKIKRVSREMIAPVPSTLLRVVD